VLLILFNKYIQHNNSLCPSITQWSIGDTDVNLHAF
jgi:hypothetical protein